MNQNRYRLVFNAHRGLLMAVAETSHRQGKCAGGESGAGNVSVPLMQSRGLLKGWRTSLALALALMGGVQAQDLPITPAGPAGARPILDAAANGVPIVHIAPPSVGGVSRNQFNDFNVNKNGLILNNSNSNIQTQLGGWITGNPQLGITPARIILNEVVGTNASQLRGTMEVAGRRADIVIANPNGLLCDACGFINTNRVTLTTGTPQFEQGRLQSLNVGQGIITIGQSGLNGSQLSQLDLLARGLVLEGEVWAQSLNSITGANQVLYGTLQTASSAGSGEAPRFAVDIKSLGGMYANQVYLVATEQGLGVNSTGRIAALTGTLQLSSNGDITLKDSYAKQDLSITGSKQVSLTGQTQSEAVLNVQAAGKLDQSGTLSTIGAGALLLNAASLNNTGSIIQQGQGPLTLNIAGEALNSGSIYSATNVSFTAGQWQDQGGVWQAQGKLDLKAGKSNLTDTHLSSGADTVLNITSLNTDRTVLNSLGKLDTNITGLLSVANSQWQSQLASKVNASDVSLDHSQLISLGSLSIQANTLTTSQSKIASKGLLSAEVGDLISSTGGDWLSEQNLQLNAGRIINSGNMQSLDISLQSKGLLDNSGGTVQSQQQLQINSQALVNKQGNLLAGKELILHSSSLNNEQGKIASIAAKTTIDTGVLSNTSGLISAATGLQIQSLALSNQAGEISSAASLNIDAQDLSNLGGAILAQDTMQLKTAALDNVQGRIIAQHDLQLNTQALTNTQGTLAAVEGALAVDTQGQTLSNTGLMQAKKTLNLSSGKLDNHGLLAGQTLDINAANIDNSQGKLIAQDGLQIKAKDLVSDAGLIQAGGNALFELNKLQNTHSTKDGGLIVGGSLALNASELNNNNGFIHSNQAQSLNVQQLNNQDGQLQSQADLTITADAVANQGGRIQASALILHAKNAIDNSSGLIQSQQRLDIASTDLNNQKGSLLAGQALQLKTAALDNIQGKIASTAAKTTLNTAAINNEQGLITSATGTVVSSQALSNQGGEISSTADLNIDTHGQKLSNLSGSVLAQGKIQLATGTMDNAKGRLLAQQNMQIDSAVLSNAQGTIASVEGALSLDTHGQVLSNSGKLQARQSLDVRTAKLLNQGLLAGSSIAIDSLAVDNSHGQLIAQDALKMKAGDVLSDAGLIQAGGHAQLDVQNFTNTHSGKDGGVLVGGQLTLNADDLDNRSGLIHSNLAQVLNVQQLNNQDGQLQSQSALTLKAQKIDNQAGHIQAADLTIKTPNQLDNRLGTLQGVQKLQIESQQLLNQGGSVLSGQDLLLNTAAFDNSQGKIASTAGKVTLNADALSNDKGLISSATGTIISSQALSNKGGEINSAADVSLNTHGQALSNMAGSILAQGKMQLDIAALDNAQGRIQAQQNLQLNSQEISNTQGTIASVEGAMRIDTHGNALSNQDGQLQAKQALDLESGKLDNHGLLAGQILTINSQNIDNSQGQLIALDALKINAGELLSDAGLIQAGANAQLDVDKLQNTHSSKEGGVIVGGTLTVNTGELDNSSGQIYSKAAQTLNASLLNNQAGQLQSQSALTINADEVRNLSGQVQAAALTIKTNNGLDNSKGSIQSQQQLDISSQSLSNHGGSVLAGQNVNLQTGALDNSQGKIASTAGQTNLISAALNNDAGLISSATGTQISSQALSNKAGELNSAADLAIDTHGQAFSNGGAVVSNGKMQLLTGELANADGRILAQQDLHISSQAISSNGTIASVEGSASVDTHGQALSNTGKLQAKLALDIQSGQLDNHGLLAGQNIGLNTANIDNSRGQLIAQDALKINAGNLISDAGLIQAGKTAQLDVAKLQNTHSATDGGLISGGTLTVNTGELDNSSGQIYSKAAQTMNTTLLNNQAGQLQSQGLLAINADNVQNQSGQIQAAALELKAKISLDNNKGSIQSQQQLDISSQSLSNQGGSLLAGQNVNLQTGALDNSQGKIASTAGQTAITSAALNNDAGLISSATGTQISSQALSNKAGEINSAADLNIDTHGQLFSNGGAVLANGKMQLTIGVLDNADGRILAQQDLHISSQGLSSNGTIASVEGNASVDSHGQALNNTGKLQAKLALDIQSGQLDNHGLLAGQNIGLNAANIDNSRGQLIAQDALKINAGNLISDAGLIQAGKAAQLDVAKLQNTHSAADGGLISGGTLTVNTGELDNSSGQIYSKAAQTLNTGLLNNQAGQLQSQGALTINADDVCNQSGQIQAAALELKAKNSLDNNKGSIQSQQQLDISSQSLSNQGGRVLAGQNVNLQTGALDNSQGKIASTAGQTNLSSAALNNDAGLISSATGTQISSQALSNKAGEINSAADLNIDTHGQVFSNGGAVLANGKMQLTTGTLDNADGRILAQQDLHISSQAISSSGTIASVEGSASVDTHGQALNNTGKLQAKLALDIQSGLLDNHGLLAGQNIGLNAANIDNSRGQLIAQDALKINTGNLISDAGLIQAGKAAQLDVAKLQNTHSAADGGLISGGTLTVNTGELNNSSGQIYSKAAQTLNASHINNQSGQLQSQGALTINADDLSNQSGQVQAAALTIKTNNGIDNSKGSIQSQQQLDISSQSLSNQGGSVLAGQNLLLQTGALNNSQGKIASTAGQAAITSADLNNQSGLISSAAGTTLVSQTIKNDGGEISSEASLAINTQGHALSNIGGSLLAKNGALNLSSAALDNSHGRILAKDQLALIAHGLLNSGGVIASTTGDIDLSSHNLNNQNGKIQADTGLLKIQTGTVNNSQAGLLAAKNIQLNTADIDNSQGQIIAVANIDTKTGRVFNQSGLIQAGSNITINTQGQDFINTQSHFDQADLRGKQGLIAGGTLQLDAASLVNTAGYIFSGQSQNINLSGDFNNASGVVESKSALNIKAQSLNNSLGSLTALGDADINLSGVFANQGRLNVGGSATIKASALDNKNGRIDAGHMVLAVTQFNNGKGVVETSAGANINSNSLDNLDGSIAAGTDLALTINGDYTHQGVLQAKGDLALASNHLVNKGKLISNHQTTITTGNLDNRGEISSLETTHINANGQLDNSGDGLIDGFVVRIDAGTINNTRRIYGDKLSIGANTINNRDTGVIAARTDLQLGATTLNNLNTTGNQDGALIFSLGNASIGGGLDTEGNAHGQMSVLNNESSRIDIANNLFILANTVENKNIYLDIKQKTTTEKVAFNQVEIIDGSGKRYDEGELKYRGEVGFSLENYGYYTGRSGLVKPSSIYPHAKFGSQAYAVPFYTPPPKCGGGGGHGPSGGCGGAVRFDYADSDPIWNIFGRDGDLASKIIAFNADLDSRTYGNWNTYRFDSKTVTQSTVEKSAPSKIIAGGNMTLLGSAINNQDSALVAGGQLLGDVKNINNVSKQQGTRTEELKGSVAVNGGNWQALTLPPQTVSVPLMTVTYEGVSGAGVVKDKLGLLDAGQHTADKSASAAASQQQGGQVIDAALQQANQAQMADIAKAQLNSQQGVQAKSVDQAAMASLSQTQLSGANAATLVQQSSAQMQQAEQATLGGAKGPTKSDVEQAQMAKATLTGLIKESNAPTTKQLAEMGPVSGQKTTLLADKQQVQTTVDQAEMSDTAKVQLKDAQAAQMAQTSQQAGPKIQSMQLGLQGRVLTMLPNLVAPNNSLFKLHAAPDQRYLVETDPRFTNQRSFLSSDYFIQNLAKDPSQQLKRYGDGFFEQKLINDQILALTGRRFLSDYRDTESEFKALMNAGISFAKQYQLTPGVALSAEQMALLSTDMVWLSTQTVTLADGSKQDVLVPQVYLRRLEQGDLQIGGAVISAREVHLSSSEDLVNRNSSIVGDKLTLNAGRDVLNDHGQIGGQQVFIHAKNDLQNQSGQIVGMGEGSKLSLSAGRDIVLQTLAMGETKNAAGSAKQSNLDRQAIVQGGEISLSAGRDLLLKAASVQAGQDLSMQALGKIDSQSIATSSSLHLATDGDWAGGRTGYLDKQSTQQNISSISAGGTALVVAGDRLSLVGTNLHAGKDLSLQGSSVQIEAVKERLAGDDQRAGNDKYDRHAFSKESLQGGSVTAGQNLSIKAVGPDGNITLKGADLLAEKGQLSLAAKKDIDINSINLTQTDTRETFSESRGWFSSSTTTTYDFSSSTQALGTSLSGNSLKVQAGNDIRVNGSSIVGEKDVELLAGRDINILAASNQSQQSHLREEKKSGIFSDGLSISIGSKSSKDRLDQNNITQSDSASMVGSLGGKVSVQAGRDLKVSGSDVSALAGSIALEGRNVSIETSQDQLNTKQQHEEKTKGLSLSVTGTPYDTIQNLQTIGDTQKGRQRAQSTLNELAASGLDTPGLGLAYQESHSGSSTDMQSTTHRGSQITAGSDISIIARGEKDAAGKLQGGDLTVSGSSVQGEGNTQLKANNQVSIVAMNDRLDTNSDSYQYGHSISLGVPSLGDAARTLDGAPNAGHVSSLPYNQLRKESDGKDLGGAQTASLISGKTVEISAGQGDIQLAGSSIISQGDVTLSADNGRIIGQSGNVERMSELNERGKQIGEVAGGNFSQTNGVRQSEDHWKDQSVQQGGLQSHIVSQNGSVSLKAKEQIALQGTDINAGQDLLLASKRIDISSSADQQQHQEQHQSQQTGITTKVSSAVISAVQTAEQMMDLMQGSKDARTRAMAAGAAALAAYNGVQAAQAMESGSIAKISITAGQSSTQSEATASSTTHQLGAIRAGNDIKMTATGGGSDSNITITGTKVDAAHDLTLQAENKVTLQAAKDSKEQHSSNSSTSGGVGVAADIGQGGMSFGITAEASASRGKADGSDVVWQNSQLNAGKTLTLISGGDTNLRGATVTGQQVIADIKGNLNIESLQDISKFDNKQIGGSASVTIGFGSASGSASASYDKTHNDYAAVSEQSGIFAGKDGFDIKVKNNTDLIGAVIASSSDSNKLSTGTLTQKDISNHAETDAISLGGGLDFSSSSKEQTSQTKGADQSNVSASAPSVMGAQESDSSSTKSAISKGQITLTDDAKQKELTGQTAAETIASLNHDTDGAQQKLANHFDQQQLAEQMAAAKALVQETGHFMANRAADADKAKAALEATDKALTAENAKPAGQKDQARIDDLTQQQARQTEQKADADKWTPGGEYGRAMTVLQVAVGGNVTGGMSGLLQNATVSYLQSIGAEKIKAIADSFQEKKGTEDATSGTIRAALHAIASCAGAAATSSNCSSAAVGAASSVVINNVLSEIENTNADKMTASEKEKRKNLVGSIITGIVAATDGNAAAANNAAQIEMQNNWLSPSQNAQYLKELKAAKSLLDEIKVSGKWAYTSGKQDALTTTGIGKGLAESGWSDVKGVAQFLADPIAGLNGLKQIITSPEVRQQLGETILGELNLKMARMDQALTQGGDVQAEQFGKDLGSLIWQVGSVATGVGGVAKGGVALAKAGVVLSEQGLEALVNTAKFDQLVAKGGVFAVDGKPLMDFRNLTNAQKSVVGDLLGGEKITSLAPGAQKIGRSPGIGQTGIDDLYKVNKPNVDYIVVEYKFGSSVLKETKDGLQMSDDWLNGTKSGYDRILESVGGDQKLANKVEISLRGGRVEKLLVHTDPFGRVTVGVLDRNGKFFPDPKLASKVLGGVK